MIKDCLGLSRLDRKKNFTKMMLISKNQGLKIYKCTVVWLILRALGK